MSTKNTRKEISPHNGWIEKEFAFILSQTRSDTAWIDVTNAFWRPSKEISKCFSLSLTFPSFSFTLHNYRPCEHLISNQITVAWLKRALFTRSSRHESSDRNLNIFFFFFWVMMRQENVRDESYLSLFSFSANYENFHSIESYTVIEGKK